MGLFSAIGSLFGTSSTNSTNLKIARMNNEANLKLAREQNQWNLEQWKRENSYNSPARQAERLKEAGLSASAIAQSVGNVPANPLQSADLANQQAPSMIAPDLSGLGGIDNLIGLARQATALRAEKAQADMAESQRDILPDMLFTDLDLKKANIRSLNQTYEQSAKAFPTTLSGLMAETANKWQANRIGETQHEILKTTQKQVKADFDFTLSMNPLKIKQLGQELEKQLAEIKNLNKDLDVKNAQIANIEQNTEESKERQKNLATSRESQELSNILTRFGSPESVAQRTSAMLVSGNLSIPELESSLIGIQKYLKSGYKALDNPRDRKYLLNIYDEGSGVYSHLNPFTQGTQGVSGIVHDILH